MDTTWNTIHWPPTWKYPNNYPVQFIGRLKTILQYTQHNGKIEGRKLMYSNHQTWEMKVTYEFRLQSGVLIFLWWLKLGFNIEIQQLVYGGSVTTHYTNQATNLLEREILQRLVKGSRRVPRLWRVNYHAQWEIRSLVLNMIIICSLNKIPNGSSSQHPPPLPQVKCYLHQFHKLYRNKINGRVISELGKYVNCYMLPSTISMHNLDFLPHSLPVGIIFFFP